MKNLTKRDMAILEKAYQVLTNKIDDELYEELLDEGCQPGTASGSLGEILTALNKET